MATLFSETLTRLRREAGFPTAYRFFHDNCGAKVLGMGYRKYLLMEQGKILPLFKHLRAFVAGLRINRHFFCGLDFIVRRIGAFRRTDYILQTAGNQYRTGDLRRKIDIVKVR